MDDRELPEKQRLVGMVTMAELATAGFTNRAVRELVRRAVLADVGRGVYVNAEQATRFAAVNVHGERILRAAGAALRSRSTVLSHVDAALVHGLALLERPDSRPITVTKSARAKGRRCGRTGLTVHVAALPGRHVTSVNGIPVTSVERTVVDLARSLPFAAGVVTADSALFQEKTTAGRLYRVLGDCVRWPGIARAREAIDFSHPLAESPLESISRVAFGDGGLPPPVLQAWIFGDHGPIGRADFLWKERQTIAEADGAMKYEDPSRARRQLRRDSELRAAGYEVVHFTWHDITTRPERVIAQIQAAFDRSSRLRTRPRAG